MSESNERSRIIVRGKDFRKTFGIPDSTRADWETPNHGVSIPPFPRKSSFGLRSVGYYYSEVMAWLDSRRSE
jgi:predicted DNA-binding transcriptional regulator AlpA